MKDILVVEDNLEMGTLLCDFLEAEGFSVEWCKDGEKAIECFQSNGAKIILLDIMLPEMNGFEVCRKIRESSNAPIIMVSAKIAKDDKLNGLVAGADDYIEKPYDIDILIAKIKGIFSRRYATTTITDGDLILDKEKRLVTRCGKSLDMTQKEFDLLTLLMENAGKAMNKEKLFNSIWGFDSFSEAQTLTVHIKWLRQKIENDSKHPQKILTVWGVGYRYEKDEI